MYIYTPKFPQKKNNSHKPLLKVLYFSFIVFLILLLHSSSMINTSNEFSRRILIFPAIRPCESVSFSSLINSLINLGHTICSFKSKTFFTNKRKARDSIRLIETLVVFLEEMRNGIPRFDDSMLLSLSELHFIFQKVHFLLEDCTRSDARLWMLSKSEKVANHFRVLMKAIGVALDVLPCMEMDEVQDLLDFMKKQALKGRFDVEKDDVRNWRKVVRILDQFEGGIAPEPVYLKMVLEYLGIKSWFECNDEVKFLESEIAQEISTNERRDVGFVSSLMAFMIYCRCIVCENDACVRSSNLRVWSNVPVILGLNPDDLRCPITLEIMTDPVTVSTGHTYDRSSIMKWFKSGNHSCPKTGEKLICVELVPNYAVKQLIKQYFRENEIPFPELGGQNRDSKKSLVDAGSVAAEQTMMLLAMFLVTKLLTGTNDERCKSAYEIRLLTKTSVFNRSCLVEGGVIQPLLDILRSDDDPVAQENAMAALLNLSKYSTSKRIMVENGGLELIVEVLNTAPKVEARQHAAGTLFYLASIEEYRRKIGRIPDAISGLMGLISNGPDRGKKNALVSILGLLLYPENHWRVLSAGLVPLVADLLESSDREDLIIDSLDVLTTLAKKLDGAMAIVSSGMLPIVIGILCSSNSRAINEFCVSLLLALCINDGADVVPILVKNPSLMVALYSLLAEGSSRSSKKASSLIRILHAFNEKGLMASGIHQEQYVHVW